MGYIPANKKVPPKKSHPSATKKILDLNNTNLRQVIEKCSLTKYNQGCKPLEVDTVVSLICGNNTLVLAATGFGKSRIAKLYLNLMPKDQKGKIFGIFVVLNPLDALGNNQVEEKEKAQYTAINLTQMLFDSCMTKDLNNGFDNFIYVSPEDFVNSKSFGDVYLSPTFQQKLVLVVVDQAQFIYSWGMQAAS
jgi:superfamily II DNA helicase RecQ